MTAYNSSVSAFKVNSTIVPAVGSMAMSAPRPPQDVTPIGAMNSYFLSGVLSTIVSLDVYYNKTDHSTLTAELLNPAGIPVEIFFNTSAAATDVLSGTATVVSMDVVTSAADVVRGSYVLQFTGPVTINEVEAAKGVLEIPAEP